MRQAVDMYLDDKRRHGLAPLTIESYEDRLWLILGLPGNDSRPVRWVMGRGEDLYQATLQRENGKARAGDTHINALNIARMWGKFCIERKLLKANPFASVKRVGRKRHGSTKERLTVNESRQLEAYCFADPADQDRVLTYGYLMLGKRASELVGCTVADLDDDGWLVRIRKAKSTASVGSVPVPAELREMLVRLAAVRETAVTPAGEKADARKSREPLPLFVNQSGFPMSRYVAYNRVRAVLKAAGVTVLPPQALRRTFTDNAGRQGFALRSIASMTGHDEAVTKRNYIERDVLDAAAVERNFKVLAGGKR